MAEENRFQTSFSPPGVQMEGVMNTVAESFADKNGEQQETNVQNGGEFCSIPCALAMAYVPWQKWRKIHPAGVALSKGTIFEELDFPFMKGRLLDDRT